MNKLWAPWRMDYIRTPREDGCVFCKKHQSTKDRENLLLFRGEESFVLMNLYPYSNGHLMISPYKHTSNTNDISEIGNQEIMSLTNKSMEIIKNIMGADGFNIGANLGKAAGAGIEEHLHFHIVPRWIGDTNFMPVVGNTKVIVEGLQEAWDSMKPQFDLI